MGVHVMRVRAASTGWAGAPGLNTFYFTAGHEGSEGEPTSTEAELAYTRVQAAMSALASVFPANWRCLVNQGVDVIDAANGDLVNSISAGDGAAIAGTNGSGYGPTAVMLLARLNTGHFADGSRIQGRAFLGPMASDASAAGTPGTIVTAAGNAFATAIQDAGGGGVPVLTVWRREREARGGDRPLAHRDGSTATVTSVTIPGKFAILRSRRD